MNCMDLTASRTYSQEKSEEQALRSEDSMITDRDAISTNVNTLYIIKEQHKIKFNERTNKENKNLKTREP